MLKYSWSLHLLVHNTMSFSWKLKNVLAFFQQPCFKISAKSTFNWLPLLVAADLQVCGVYHFRIDVSMKRSFTHLLTESIAATLKGFFICYKQSCISVCALVLRRFKYSFKRSTIHRLLLGYALWWKLSNFFPCFECLRTWLGENVPLISVTVILSTVKKLQCSFFGLPAAKARSKVFV